MYTKRGGVAAYHIVRIGCARGVFQVCVFLLVLWTTGVSAVESSTALTRTRIPGTFLKHNRSEQHDMPPNHHA